MSSPLVRGRARITALTPNCTRLEYSESELFLDEPTLFARERPWLGTRLNAHSYEDDGALVVDAGVLRIYYTEDGLPFHRGNLRAELHGSCGGGNALSVSRWNWRPGAARPGANLGGTLPSLDQVSGPVRLGSGLLSCDGFFLLDDSGTPVLRGTTPERSWAVRRPVGRSEVDWYLFGYGLDFQAALHALMIVSGRVPLPRKYAFGSWYSRYWPHTSQEYRDIVEEYRQHGFPLDVVVLDMDWHKGGWTGWSWDRELLPDAEQLLAWLHDQGLHVTLNVHPADGVGPQEDAYNAFMRDASVSRSCSKGSAPPTCECGGGLSRPPTLPFDAADEQYMTALFHHVHKPLEDLGVDFWWLDWQQDTGTRSLPELCSLAWLNELYFRESKSQGLRGLQLSRWGGWGDHTKAVHFSGDTSTGWPMLAFVVPFTVTASNVGCFFWSHDIGGHMGPRNEESYARWAQFGATSATMRIHSARSEDSDRRPWNCAPHVETSLRVSWQLRHALLPYIYSSAFQCYADMRPLLRPMYLDLPGEEEAYRCSQQYFLGDAFIVAPIVTPGYGPGKLAAQTVWLPEGVWYNYLTGDRFEGGRRHLVAYELDEFPLFVRSGHPIPLQPPASRMSRAGSLSILHIRCFPGLPGSSTSAFLYEDDGESAAYETGERALTRLSCKTSGDGHQLTVQVGPTEGSFAMQLPSREVVLEFCGFGWVELEGAWINYCNVECRAAWDLETNFFRVSLPQAGIREDLCVKVRLAPYMECACTTTAIGAAAARTEAAVRRARTALGGSAALAMARACTAATASPCSGSWDSSGLSRTLSEPNIPSPVPLAVLAAHGVGLHVANVNFHERRLVAYLFRPVVEGAEPSDSASEVLMRLDGGITEFFRPCPSSVVWQVPVPDSANAVEARLCLHGRPVRLIWLRDTHVAGEGRIWNLKRPGWLLRVGRESGAEAGPVDEGQYNREPAMEWWRIECVESREGYVRLRSLQGAKQCVHVEHGEVEVGLVKDCWESALWILDRREAYIGHVQFRNRWKPDQVLFVKDARLNVGCVEDESAWWRLVEWPGRTGCIRVQSILWSDYYLHIESGELVVGLAEPGWDSALWRLEQVELAGSVTGCVRLQSCRAVPQFLHIEQGGVEVGPVEDKWESAQWKLEKVEGRDGYVRIRNLWKADQCLHVERNVLEIGPIELWWESGMWQLPCGREAEVVD